MTRQHQREASRVRRTRPALLVSVLALVLLGAITGGTMLTSNAAAFSGLTGSGAHRASTAAKSVKSSQPAAPATSKAPASAAPDPSAGGPAAAPSKSAPLADLPPLQSASPAPSPTSSGSPSAAPSDTAGAGDSSSPSAQASDSRSGPTTSVAQPGAESNRVGALFGGSVGPGNHFCTASVVHSPGHDLILTAAHCVSNTNGVSFVPGYRDGKAPFGSWQVTKLFTTNGWSQNGDPDQDFALLQVAPNASGQQVEDVVGAENLGLNEPFTATVRLYGYPNSTENPIVCSNATTQQSAYQRRIDCPSYPNGTSGGPWISTTTGNVIGVIGGYQQGGDTDDTSYSAYFDSTIGNLYQLATSS
jgi:V8-like Glu-specific endopeptidase